MMSASRRKQDTPSIWDSYRDCSRQKLLGKFNGTIWRVRLTVAAGKVSETSEPLVGLLVVGDCKRTYNAHLAGSTGLKA